MKKLTLFITLALMLAGCTTSGNHINVHNTDELVQAVESIEPGDQLLLADGVYKDVQLKISVSGTAENPVMIRAENAGKVSFEGLSNLKLGGTYITIKDIQFKNGHTPDNAVIQFKIDDQHIASHCRITNCVIESYNQPNRYTPDHWVEFWGRHNQLDHCYIAGKSNNGPTVRVFLKGNEHIRNYHQIVNNYFGPRPRKGGPHGETIQIGESYTSMTPSYVIVRDNYFERCNGEVEVISSKSNFNEFRNNIFYECEGSLVLRHGNYCLIDGNRFIGNPNSQFMGGIRVINTGHWITNNYFYQLQADEFRAPLAIMNGIPKSPLNRYNQVTDVVVAYNSWIDCRTPWQFSVGANMKKKDVLPRSEIRSARPRRVLLANNLVYNHQTDPQPIKMYDKLDGIRFEGNVFHNGDQQVSLAGIVNSDLQLKQETDWLYVPDGDAAQELSAVYHGFDFEQIETDLFGNSRRGKNRVGAIAGTVAPATAKIDKSKYGPDWFNPSPPAKAVKVHSVKPGSGKLSAIVAAAADGDIIELAAGSYDVEQSLNIDKQLTLRAVDKNSSVKLSFTRDDGTLFIMQPNGNLYLNGLDLKGSKAQTVFSTLKENMSAAYRLHVSDCRIENFKQVLKAYRGSFADSMLFRSTTFKNCAVGLELAAETNDKGDYNAEFLTISNCRFEQISQEVLNYYRGGYDESTIGGNLLVENSTFTNCGRTEKSKILLKTRGIINVRLNGNIFTDNPVKLVALLWGEKNNTYQANKILRSGRIRVDKYLKQKLMY